MLINSYTVSQLIDLALQVPEIGAVNFNILHTILKTLAFESGVSEVKPWCNIENPSAAQIALTALKLKTPPPSRKSISELHFAPIDGQDYNVRRIKAAASIRPFTADDVRKGETTPLAPIQSADEISAAKIEQPATAETDPRPVPDEESEETDRKTVQFDVVRVDDVPGPSEPETPSVPGQVAVTVQNIIEGIEQGQQSQLLSEVWRATNLNRRMDATEECLQQVSFVMDRIVDRMNESGLFLEEIKPHWKQLRQEMEILKEINKEKFEELLKTLPKAIVESEDFKYFVAEKFEEVKPVFIESLEEKVEYVGGAVKTILEETGIQYTPPLKQGSSAVLVGVGRYDKEKDENEEEDENEDFEDLIIDEDPDVSIEMKDLKELKRKASREFEEFKGETSREIKEMKGKVPRRMKSLEEADEMEMNEIRIAKARAEKRKRKREERERLIEEMLKTELDEEGDIEEDMEEDEVIDENLDEAEKAVLLEKMEVKRQAKEEAKMARVKAKRDKIKAKLSADAAVKRKEKRIRKAEFIAQGLSIEELSSSSSSSSSEEETERVEKMEDGTPRKRRIKKSRIDESSIDLSRIDKSRIVKDRFKSEFGVEEDYDDYDEDQEDYEDYDEDYEDSVGYVDSEGQYVEGVKKPTKMRRKITAELKVEEKVREDSRQKTKVIKEVIIQQPQAPIDASLSPQTLPQSVVTTTQFNDVLEDVWNELEICKQQFAKLQARDKDVELEDWKGRIERSIKRIIDQMSSYNVTIEHLTFDLRNKDELLRCLQDMIENLSKAKVDTKELTSFMEQKANKREVASKLDRLDFENVMDEMSETLNHFVLTVKQLQTDQEVIVNDIQAEIKLRLRTADYEAYQEPILNRIKSLMFGFRNMKATLVKALYPDAAGITKCVSCSRPAVLAGSKFQEAGHIPSPGRRSDDFTMANLTPYEKDNHPSSVGERSIISLPYMSIRKITPRNEGSEPRQILPPISKQSMIGLKRPKSRKQMQKELDLALDANPVKRFTGGEHTKTKPGQRRASFNDLQIPAGPRHVGIMGCDSSLYKGTETSDMKITSKDLENLEDEDFSVDKLAAKLSPQTFPLLQGRTCGGVHTLTDPLQKGIKFLPLRMTDNPLKKKVQLRDKDKASNEEPTDEKKLSKTGSKSKSRISIKEDVKPSVSKTGSISKSRQSIKEEVKPNIVSMSLDPSTINKPVANDTSFEFSPEFIPLSRLKSKKSVIDNTGHQQ